MLHLDARVVAVSKPAGFVVHKSAMARDRIVVLQAVRDAIGKHLYPVHRLDRGTSGVLLFALDPDAARHFHASFDAGLSRKVYRAIVRGDFGAVAGSEPLLVNYPVPKDEDGEKVPAQTTFFLEESFGWCSLVRAEPATGRFHQIRRHLSHLRHPLANDTNYGTGWFNRKVRSDLGLSRMALHASSLTIPHPDGGMLMVEDRAPEDFAEALRRLRESSVPPQ